MYYRTLQQFLDDNGYWIGSAWMPRVTKIVEMKRKEALERFYGNAESYAAAKRITSKAAEEGTLVHEAVESILLGKEPEIDPVIAPTVEAFRKFMNSRALYTTRDWVEQRIVSYAHRYAGTADILVEIDGVFSLLDIKTASAPWRDYGIQTSAYLSAINEAGGLFHGEKKIPIPKLIEKRYILLLNRRRVCAQCGAEMNVKGEREKVYGGNRSCSHAFGPIEGQANLTEYSDTDLDFRAFLACKDLWEWENKEWLEQINL